MRKKELVRYTCKCGNRCLVDTPPDNSICGGCKNPDWKRDKIQEPYRVKQKTVKR